MHVVLVIPFLDHQLTAARDIEHTCVEFIATEFPDGTKIGFVLFHQNIITYNSKNAKTTP
jgi:hypothetical protein